MANKLAQNFLKGGKASNPQEEPELSMDILLLAQKGKLEALKAALAKGISPDLQDESGTTALMMAALYRRYSVARFLLEQGADPNLRNFSQWNSLMHAASGGSVKIIDLLIEFGSEINAVNDYGRTALIEAAYAGHLKAVESLLRAGCDLNLPSHNPEGATALTEACWQGHEEIVRLLISKGANLNDKGRYGQSLISWAAANAHTDLVLLCLDQGIDANFLPAFSMTPLMAAVSARGVGPQRQLETVRLLLERGAALDVRDFSGRDVYFYSGGAPAEIVELIISRETSEEAMKTLCLEAIRSKNKGSLKFLKTRGVAFPPESCLIGSGLGADWLKFLLELGCDPNSKADGQMQSRSAMHIAASRGDSEALRVLIDAGGQIDGLDANGNTALFDAAFAGHLECFLLLLSCGANVYHKNFLGVNLLMRAAASANSAIVSLLLQRYDFELDAQDAGGKTALSWAFYPASPSLEAIEQLLAAGADPDAGSHDAYPLMLACSSGLYEDRYQRPLSAKADPMFEPVSALLAAGASPQPRKKEDGWPFVEASLLRIARQNRCPEIAELLAQHGAIDED